MEITIIQSGNSLPYAAHGHSTEKGRSTYMDDVHAKVRTIWLQRPASGWHTGRS